MKITREWAMPNKRTFQIKPIHNLICQYLSTGIVLDPFPFDFKEDALEMLSRYSDGSVSIVRFDPPYSLRQLKECYKNKGQAITGDESRTIYTKWKDEIARVLDINGICLSFGWNSNGLGKKRGFEIERILLVAHGGGHNDTICTVERKIQETLE